MGSRSQLEKVATVSTYLKPPEVTMPWFESGVVATKPKIKQKVGQLAHVKTLFDQDIDTERNALPCPGNAILPSKGGNAMSQVYTTNLGTTRQFASTKELQLYVDESRQRECQNVDASNRLTLLSYERRTKEEIHPGPPSTSSRSRGEASNPVSVSVSEFSTDNTVDSEMEHSLPEASGSKEAQTFADSAFNSRNRFLTQERYTMRQLARIALVSANGSRMTTSQVFVWLARTFSYLQVGEGGWERSVQACLSRFDEFDSRTIPGGRRSRKIYGFKDVGTRKRYEEEYSEFFATSSPHSKTELNIWRENKNHSKEPVNVMRAVKSAPSRFVLTKKQASPSALTERHHSHVQDNPTNIETNAMHSSPLMKQKADHNRTKPSTPKLPPEEAGNTYPSMSSARSVPPQPSEVLNLHPNIERVATFQAAFADLEPSIETMTEVEKAQKIVEIKARPSRKKYFGEDYRLAHKRRYGLEDIHDERDGAWKPPRPTANELQPSATGSVDPDTGKAQFLRGLFNLPDNAIPMNDGHMELAFRDGTLVNGRLPRPRNVYKVGKLFGGELTVRMS
jgi:hypothetical protein